MCDKKIDDFIGVTFVTPKNGILTVVGWSGERNKGGAKLYNVECDVCIKDQELFNEPFLSLKGNLNNGFTPCGCSVRPRWTQDQYVVLLSREAHDRRAQFLGFVGDWKGRKTKISIQCDHDHIYQSTIDSYKNGGCGCMSCWIESEKAPSVGNGYYPTQLDRIDTLYLLVLGDNEAIKVGRTFQSQGETRYKKIARGMNLPVMKYRIITASHKVIFAIEQMIVKRTSKFKRYDNDFSTEVLEYGELQRADLFLDNCVTHYGDLILSDIY